MDSINALLSQIAQNPLVSDDVRKRARVLLMRAGLMSMFTMRGR